jgi:hypothetical protein
VTKADDTIVSAFRLKEENFHPHCEQPIRAGHRSLAVIASTRTL